MPRSFARCLAAALAVALAGCGATAPRTAAPTTAAVPARAVVDTGTLGAAPYRIDIPADWNGELVVNAHGYEPAGAQRQTPMPFEGALQPLLDRGFAVAASGYSAQGWVIAEAVADSERLRRHFAARHGRPTRTWIVGWSMGGLVALASAERAPRAWDGVVAMCGVGVSTEAMVAQGALRPLAAFDALFPGVLPQAPAGLADPSLPAAADGGAIEAALAADEARATALARQVGIARGDLAGSLWLYYLALRELAVRAGGFPVSTATGEAGVDDDEAALGVRIRRYRADPRALAYVRSTGGLSGRAPVPVVLQPNATDPIVPARFSSGYAALAEAAGRGDRVSVLPGVGDGHCRFPPSALPEALQRLRAD